MSDVTPEGEKIGLSADRSASQDTVSSKTADGSQMIRRTCLILAATAASAAATAAANAATAAAKAAAAAATAAAITAEAANREDLGTTLSLRAWIKSRKPSWPKTRAFVVDFSKRSYSAILNRLLWVWRWLCQWVSGHRLGVGIALVGMFITVVGFYPGFTNWDAEWQLQQAISQHYDDWHPPCMSWLWHLLNVAFPLTSGTPNMFLFCALIFWVSLAIVACLEEKTNPRRLLFAALVGLPPPMFFMLAYVWKDYLMAVAMFLAYALLLLAEFRRSKLALVVAVLALFLAYVARHNGIFAVFPLSVWAVSIAFDLFHVTSRKLQHNYVKVLLALGVCAFLTIAKTTAEFRLVNGHTSYPLQILLLYDVVGISVRTDENWVPGCFDRKEFSISLPYLRRRYDSFNSFQLLFPTEQTLDITPIRFLNERYDVDWLWTNWIFAVMRHPLTYLEHRTEMFLSTLDLAHSNMLLRETYAGAPRFMPSWYILSPTALDGYGYLIVLFILACLSLCHRLRLERSVLALIYSGLAYGVAYFLVAPGNDQRYYFWSIMACWIAVVTICLARIQLPAKVTNWWTSKAASILRLKDS